MAATLGCRAASSGDDSSVYYSTVPLTDAAAESLASALLRQDFGISHAASTGAPGGVRRGVVLFESGQAADAERVVAWLRAQPAVAKAGRDTADVW
jgi:hypothetical protein